MRVLFALLTSLAIAPTALAQAKPVTTASGLVFESIKEGTGDSPKATDTVKVHYKGTLLDGKEFDSSYKRGEPTEFPLNRVIPCWTEGVQRMKPGAWHCLWRAWRGWCDSAQRHAEFRGGAGLGAPLSIGNARVAAGLRGRTLQRSGNGLAAQGVRHLPAPSDRRP
jgi:FKBP-type peptidyl-prolyl cis-trans isomerase FkpA